MGYVPYVGFATYRRATMMNRLMFYKCFVQKKKKGRHSQAVRTRSYFGKNCAILERWSQNTVHTQLNDRLDITRQSSNLNSIRFSVSL